MPKNIWLVRIQNDETPPIVCGVATSEDIANKIVAEIHKVFDDTFEYSVSKWLLDTIYVNDKLIACGDNNSVMEADAHIVWGQNDETDPFVCGIASTKLQIESIKNAMDQIFGYLDDETGEIESPYEYTFTSLIVNAVCIDENLVVLD